MNKVKGFQEAKQILFNNRSFDTFSYSISPGDFSVDLFGTKMTLNDYISRIISEVRQRGDEAIFEFVEKIEGNKINNISVPLSEAERAYRSINSELRESLEIASNRIKHFQERSLPENWKDEKEGYGQNFLPVTSAGAYIPGGTACYPSTVLMTAIPAKVAGVRDFSIASPALNTGLPHPSVLAAAYIAGVDNIYTVGGPHAIAALAFGTESVLPVDVICGPGNVFVTMAKKLVYGQVGIDGLYGPTETLIIADSFANPVTCALDLLAQAEHDVNAFPVFITTSQELSDEVEKQLTIRLSQMQRSEIAMQSILNNGINAVVDSLEEAMALSNGFAPEHLSLAVKDPERLISKVTNAGMVFTGEFSHEVLGDYGAGPSHVMPTAGTARFNGGLGVFTFLKPMPVVSLSKKDALSITSHAVAIAREEGLHGHADAAEIRRELS